MRLEDLDDVHPWSGSLHVPSGSSFVTLDGSGRRIVPAYPVVPFIEGDGIGPEITPAMILVVNAAVRVAYGGTRRIAWVETLASGKAEERTGSRMPRETLELLDRARIGIKGPLGTPVGAGGRSLNGLLRQSLDLYSAIRPVFWMGQPAPLPHPERLDVTVFRENTDDVYTGIEYFAGAEDTHRVSDFLRDEMGVSEAALPSDSGITIKPMSEAKTKRHVRRALRYALETGRRSAALVGKGNIMKATEGAFVRWGFDTAGEPEFHGRVVTDGEPGDGQVRLGSVITDQMLMQLVLRPEAHDLVITQNLNGDYISDLAAALVGGPGYVPSGNFGDGHALFESTHGTAPRRAGQGRANPISLILSGSMLLDHLGWGEAAALVGRAIRAALAEGLGTPDISRGFLEQGRPARELSTIGFAREIENRVSP